jgi:hypothetical protein
MLPSRDRLHVNGPAASGIGVELPREKPELDWEGMTILAPMLIAFGLMLGLAAMMAEVSTP